MNKTVTDSIHIEKALNGWQVRVTVKTPSDGEYAYKYQDEVFVCTSMEQVLDLIKNNG